MSFVQTQPTDRSPQSGTPGTGPSGIYRTIESDSHSSDLLPHYDAQQSKKVQKRLKIQLAICALLGIAFLAVAIAFIVLYVQEKNDDTTPKTVTDILAKSYSFSFVDTKTAYKATDSPPAKSTFEKQLGDSAAAAFAPTYHVPLRRVENVALVQETAEVYRAVVLSTVVLVKFKDDKTKAVRRKRDISTGTDGFPTDDSFTTNLNTKLTNANVPNDPSYAPNSTANAGFCQNYVVPPYVPSIITTTAGTTPPVQTVSVSQSTASIPPPPTTSNGCPSCPTFSTPTCPSCDPATVCPSTVSTPTCPTATSCPPVTPCPTGTPQTTITTPVQTTTTRTIPPPSTTTTAPVSDKCLFDLAFIIDESESVGAGDQGSKNFKLIKEAMQYATSTEILTVSQSQNRVGWVGFSSRTYSEADQAQLFNQAVSNQQTRDAIDLITFHPGGSNAISAFNYARDVMFNSSNGNRPIDHTHKDLLILISDGSYKTWDKPIPAYTTAMQLMAKGVINYAVAVAEKGNDVDFDNLNKITGDSSHVFNIDQYEQLGQKLKEIIQNFSCAQPPTGCQGDLVLIVDRSESVGDDNFAELRTFLASLTDLFPVDGENLNKIALVSFSDTAQLEFNLNDYNNSADVASHIRNLQYDRPGATNTAEALQMVLDQILVPEKGDRVCSPDVVLLFTDGIHDVGVAPSIPAKLLRDQKKAVIVSVGIGSLINTDELHSISDPTGEVYTFEDFTHLGTQFVEYVNNITCQPDPVLAPCNDPKDVLLVIDVHKSLTDIEFNNLKFYLKYLADSFYMDDDSIRVTFVTYGSQVVESHRWQPLTNEEFRNQIDQIQRDTEDGPPALDAALANVVSLVLHQGGDRHDPDYPDVVIIIETQPTPYNGNLTHYADIIQFDGYTEILGIAGGDSNEYSANVLRYIAGGDSSRVVWLPSFVEFETETCINNAKTQQIHDLTCRYSPPPPPPATHCYTVCSDTTEAPPTTTSSTSSTRGPPPTRGPKWFDSN